MYCGGWMKCTEYIQIIHFLTSNVIVHCQGNLSTSLKISCTVTVKDTPLHVSHFCSCEYSKYISALLNF